MFKKRFNSTKKYKITKQYKLLSNEFNSVCLKARYNLSQINLFLKEREEKRNKKNNFYKISKKKDNDDSEEEKNNDKKDNNISHLEQSQKSNSFSCPSDKEFKKLIYYQKLEKNKISKEQGFQNYFQKMIKNSNEVQNLQNVINQKSSFKYYIYAFPKVESQKRSIIKKRDFVSAFQIDKKNFESNENKRIMSTDKIITNKNNKFKSKIFYKNIFKSNNNKNKRIMSAPKIDWKKKKKNWKEKNKNISEEDYRFFFDRPISPLSNDKSVKPLPHGGGVLYSNSIWRIKKINNLIPKINYNLLDKIKEFKRKRNEIIYKKQYSLPYDLTFISNRAIEIKKV